MKHTSTADTQLFKSVSTSQVIELPLNKNDRVTFLFSEASREQMTVWGWESVTESDYLGEKPRRSSDA